MTTSLFTIHVKENRANSTVPKSYERLVAFYDHLSDFYEWQPGFYDHSQGFYGQQFAFYEHLSVFNDQ